MKGNPRKITDESANEILHRAIEILTENVYNEGQDTGYTVPSGKMPVPWDKSERILYPFQWLWDTFFIAAWSTNTTQSLKDVRKFLASQRPNGFLGHIRYNREVLSRNEYFPPPNIYYPLGQLPEKGEIISLITQPPNVAYGVWELAKKINDSSIRKPFLEEVFPKIMAYHQWIYGNLVVDGLLVTIHPWQAGDDNSPKWDSVYRQIGNQTEIYQQVHNWLMYLKVPHSRVDTILIPPTERPTDNHYDIYLYLIWLYGQWEWNPKKILERSPFRVCEPISNAVLLRSNLALYEIATELGKTEEIRIAENWFSQTKSAISKLWSERDDMYLAKDLAEKDMIRVGTSASLIPLFSRAIPIENAHAMAKKITEISQNHSRGFLVPSTFFDETAVFSPTRYWRGPVWPIVNELIADGLTFYGQATVAERIRNDSLELISKSYRSQKDSFYEYYNPWTGQGLGSPNQSWTAAATIKMLSKTNA